MKYIDKQIGKLIFERIEETIENKSLSPKEKIPKYRPILDDLFKALTVDTNQYISGLNEVTPRKKPRYSVNKTVIV